jgi:hypothetical protein
MSTDEYVNTKKAKDLLQITPKTHKLLYHSFLFKYFYLDVNKKYLNKNF